MAAKKKPHAIELRDAALAAQAVSYNVHFRRSPTAIHNREAATLAEAAAIAIEMNALYGKNGKRAMIYAILPEGSPIQSVLVPPAEAEAALAAVAQAEAEIAGEPEAPEASILSPISAQIAAAKADPVEPIEPTPADQLDGAASALASFLSKGRVKFAALETADQTPVPAPKARAKREPKPAPAMAAARGSQRDVMEAAAKGVLPQAPDFSKPTHKAFVKKLAALVALVEAGDLDGVRAYPETHNVQPISSSRVAILRYQQAALAALEAQAAEMKAA